MKDFVQILNEVAYGGNVGFSEMVDFYQKAGPDDIKRMEKIIKANDWESFKKLIKKVLKVKLV
jgi:hypothetical protein